MTSDELFRALPPAGSSSFHALTLFCEDNRASVLAALPWAAAELAGHEGFASMLTFVSRCGGTRFYVPRDREGFAAKAGIAVGAAIHRRFLKEGGTAALLDIPSAWGVFLALRRVAIAAALAGGEPSASVAHRFGVTARSLRLSTN